MQVLHYQVQGHRGPGQRQCQVPGGVGQRKTETVEDTTHSGVWLLMTITVMGPVGSGRDQDLCCDHCNYDPGCGVKQIDRESEEESDAKQQA